MSDQLTDACLADLKRLCEAATKGPWKANDYVAAREALPRLIAEVEQLRAALMWIGSFTLEPEVCAKVVEVLPDAKKE